MATPLRRFPIKRLVYDLSTIYVDGAHNASTGTIAWASVVDANGLDLVAPYARLASDLTLRTVLLPRGIGVRQVLEAKFTDVVSQQINGAELLALVFGLRVAVGEGAGIVKQVCSDSTTVLAWSLKLGSKQRATFDPRKVKYIDELMGLRRQFEQGGGRVVKISGDDNLSDLGFHLQR